MRILITARARKNKGTARMLANARRDHSILLYVNNMERQGGWADEYYNSNANFSPVTVINPVNTFTLTTNIYIGHIQECHCMSTMPVLNSNTYEMTCGMSQLQNQQVQMKANYNNVNKDSSHKISMHSLPVETKRTVSLW